MEQLIQISKINDFLYSPKSLYLHSVYESFGELLYHELPQRVGKSNHETIEDGSYSTRKDILLGIPVYSERLGVVGKIDIYDGAAKKLIERKTRIKKIYDGHLFQLYAQYVAMLEAGYEITSLALHSMADNKRYDIQFPSELEIVRLEVLLKEMREWEPSETFCETDRNSAISIYRHLDI